MVAGGVRDTLMCCFLTCEPFLLSSGLVEENSDCYILFCGLKRIQDGGQC